MVRNNNNIYIHTYVRTYVRTYLPTYLRTYADEYIGNTTLQNQVRSARTLGKRGSNWQNWPISCPTWGNNTSTRSDLVIRRLLGRSGWHWAEERGPPLINGYLHQFFGFRQDSRLFWQADRAWSPNFPTLVWKTWKTSKRSVQVAKGWSYLWICAYFCAVFNLQSATACETENIPTPPALNLLACQGLSFVHDWRFKF